MTIPEHIPDAVFSNPEATLALTVVIVLLAHYQRGLSYREYMAAHSMQVLGFTVLNQWAKARGNRLLSPKKPWGAEYIGSTKYGPKQVASKLRPAFSPHLIASIKYLDYDETRVYEHSKWVRMYDRKMDGEMRHVQTEVFLFPADDGGTHIYGHVETAPTDPVGHLTDGQHDGDVHEVFADVWEHPLEDRTP